MKKRYAVTVAEQGSGPDEYPHPALILAKELRLPPIKAGTTADLQLSPHEAWSLNNKTGVTVAKAPTEDPRPWEAKAKTNDEVQELVDCFRADTEAIRNGEPADARTKLVAAKNAAMKKSAAAASAKADTKAGTKGGDAKDKKGGDA